LGLSHQSPIDNRAAATEAVFAMAVLGPLKVRVSAQPLEDARAIVALSGVCAAMIEARPDQWDAIRPSRLRNIRLRKKARIKYMQ
jgi:hypothetical protein